MSKEPKTAHDLMAQYAAACRARGQKPKLCFGLVAMAGAPEPVGTMVTWGVGRKYVEQQQENRGNVPHYEIQEFMP